MTSDDPNATAAESAVQQIGTEFRRLRALRGERLEDIAAYLDMKATFLFGIEQGDLSVIPSRREAKATVRAYANYLGLDGDRIIGPMDPIIASLSEERAPAEPQKKSWFDRTSAIILTASVLLGILVGWSWIGDVEQFDLITPPVTADDIDTGEGSLDEGGIEDDGDGIETVLQDRPARPRRIFPKRPRRRRTRFWPNSRPRWPRATMSPTARSSRSPRPTGMR